MKKQILLFLLFTFSLFAIVDFGVVGNTEPLGDKNDYEKSITEFNATKAKNEFIDSIKNAGSINTELPSCDKNSTRTFSYGYTLTKDYVMGSYVLAKKGTRINPLTKIPFLPAIIIIDGTKEFEIKTLSSLYTEQPIYILHKGNVFNFYEKYNLESSLLYKALNESFQPRCSPSVYIKTGSEFTVYEYKIEPETKKAQDANQ